MHFKNFKNLKIRKIPLLMALTIIASTTSACRSSGKEDLGGGMFNSVDDDIVVLKSGAKNPIVSPHSRQKWLEFQKSDQSEIRKIQALLATGDPLTAERSTRSYLQTNPGQIDAILVLASALAQSRQYDLASYYSSILEKNKKLKAHALNIRGLAEMMNANNISEYRISEQTLLASFNASSKQIAAGLNLGHLYLELGNAVSAIEIFRSTSVRCSKCTPAVMGYGISALRLGKNKTAESAFKDILGKNENNVKALYYLALVYKNGFKNKKKAESTLIKVANDDTPGYNALKRRAQVLMRQLKGEKDTGESKYTDPSLGGDDRTEDILTGKS